MRNFIKKQKNDETDLFQLYQDGIDYKTRIGYFTRADLHWAMYNDDQWRGIKSADLPKVQINIVRQNIDYKIASIMSQNIAINYSPMNVSDEIEGDNDAEIEKNSMAKAYTMMLTDVVKQKWETLKMEKLIRSALLNGVVTGDMVLFTYWDGKTETGSYEKGDFKTIVLDGANVFFQNPNSSDAESQEWILLTGRESVSLLKKEATDKGMPKDEVDKISSDDDTEYQAGEYGKIEMNHSGTDGKATFFIKLMRSDDGSIMYTKKTRCATICEEINMGVKKYPLNYGNWQTIKNSMHGLDEARGTIPNQIAINQMHSLVVLWMRNNAFGKVAIDSSRIKGYTNSVTNIIEVDGDLTGAIQQLAPGQFNQAIINYAELLTQATKSARGASDAALGNINPTNTSAIAVTIKQAAIPLQTVQANLYQLVEDWSLTVAEFIMAKYNNRVVMAKSDTGLTAVKYEKPPSNLMLGVRVDVGPSSYFSEMAGQSTLDNLLVQNRITMVQYLERMKKFNLIPDVEGLIEDEQKKEEMLKQQQEMMTQQQMTMQQPPQMV